MDCNEKVELARRLTRDAVERYQSESEIKKLHELMNKQFKKYVLPVKSFSDMVVVSNPDWSFTLLKS